MNRRACAAVLAFVAGTIGWEHGAGAQRLQYETIIPTAQHTPTEWHYTTDTPPANWQSPGFSTPEWKTGLSGFGTDNTPGAFVKTPWTSSDIWLRRDVTFPESTDLSKLQILIHHDEDAEVYLNGVQAVKAGGYTSTYQLLPLTSVALATLHPGVNLVAVHCHQTIGGQFIDLGFALPSAHPSSTYIPPAIPLVVHDPYFSIWSESDNLADEAPKHWTGTSNTLTSLITIDSTTYRLMGPQQGKTPKLRQTAVEVSPTQTIYHFTGNGVKVTLTFLTPAIATDLELLARPLTYITWTVEPTDAKPHNIKVTLNAADDLVTFDSSQPVTTDQPNIPGLTVLRLGSKDQPLLKRAGDHTRIDWGHLYLAANLDDSTATNGLTLDFKTIIAPASRTAMIAYDEDYAIQLMGKNLRPYWRHDGKDISSLLTAAQKEFPQIQKRCASFDAELMADLTQAGGDAYARIGAAAYRQALAGYGLASSSDGHPLMFPKENTSNGCIATVYVHYPGAPLFILLNPTLLQAQLDPVFDYAESARWKWPFAPHDLGTYPKANGQVYGGGERTIENQMPVEESGNMILMTAAIAKARNNASYAAKHWPVLTKWIAYLKDKGFDPENQLCTDDFMGHLAHNVNLSAKTIEAIGAYAMLADMLGHKDIAKEYSDLAHQFASRWVKEADDGDHFRLAFDKPNTWSQKYNLVWDRILGLNLFPKEALAKETAFYRAHQNKYGLPLDNRAPTTKTDWLCWTATLTGNPADFSNLIAPISQFLNDSPSRVPFPDYYNIQTAHQAGMFARPVIGGVFIKLLDNPTLWHKWADRSK